jgi:predicted esterase
MTRRIGGVLADLTPQRLKDLRASVLPGLKPVEGLSTARRDCVIHLFAKDEMRSIEILRTSDGTIVARDMTPDQSAPPNTAKPKPPSIARLSNEKFLRLSLTWSTFRARFDEPPAETPGTVFDVPAPYTPGWFTFDKETLGQRFLRGRSTSVPPVKRDLAAASIAARLPKNYDPKNPAGLLVWVSPMNSGHAPPPFFAAADELNLVIVGPAGAGNECPVADRYQLIFDSVATACERYHIDPRRVYITGVSGGGKIASVLWACFPEIFSGSVPIVGLACYENIPIGNGQVWPGLFNKPENRLFDILKPHRAAAMTGQKDFNYEPILAAAKILTRDGLDVKVFEYADMAHTLPKAERFTEAMRWVDEPYRQKREAEIAKAQALYDKAIEARASTTDPAKRRAALIEVTTAGPWTPAAWKAIELLSPSSLAPSDPRP